MVGQGSVDGVRCTEPRKGPRRCRVEAGSRRRTDVCPSVLLAGTRYCWMSTGLYIPGRQIIEVSLPEAAASADLKVRPHVPHLPTKHGTQMSWPSQLASYLTLIKKNPLGSRSVYFYTHSKEEAAKVQKSSLAD